MIPPEFSRPQRVDTIGTAPRAVSIDADATERAALAKRFDLIAIDALHASFDIWRDGAAIMARGTVTASVTQACIATGVPLPATIDTPAMLRFVPETALDTPPDDEIELSEDDCDVVSFTGGAIDLGEAAAETMALALDPYPRAPDADAALRAAGIKSESEAGPFAALAALKGKGD
ncbi:YceD family protein [Sphingomonas sp. GlSt437]|uniref:YceD family protein n=1 Tax=Sphingomonas sp. GlSt437 TaxID=3389970 RepID=UPI003A841AF7